MWGGRSPRPGRLVRVVHPRSEGELAALAAALAELGANSPPPQRANAGANYSRDQLEAIRLAIRRGADPLGRFFCHLRAPRVRREQGAVYTPPEIVEAMTAWAKEQGTPARVVDPGAGSGRFTFAAARAFPAAELVAIESDPLAALTLRANAACLELTDRLTLLGADYRAVDLPEIQGRTLFLGNPPYVRHHGISPEWKAWFANAAAARGLKASKLSGLHVHFFLKTLLLARPGDHGVFVTAAEWLDVNYGALMRHLLLNDLGGKALHVVAPAAMPFAETATTAVISCFKVAEAPAGIGFRRVEELDQLHPLRAGGKVPREALEKARRWSPFLKPIHRAPANHIELGELCRVHRGQVTGCNAVWVAGSRHASMPDAVLAPTVTRARELFDAIPRLSSADKLRRVIDLPVDLDDLDQDDRPRVDAFLKWARANGGHESYIARNRRAWWAVGLRKPAPILATYMARRSPAFVRNPAGARHLNIAHGIYPRDALPEDVLDALSAWLQDEVRTSSGRTYAGGLTKFEPKELERVRIPPLEELYARAEELDAGRVEARRGGGEGAVSTLAGESKLGDTRADLVIRLHDGRAMPVECKTSNSAVNSFKRINHEAVGKARLWLDAFGKRGIVPCAVIGGVFNPMSLQGAQQEGLTIIWSHRLPDLASFIAAAR